MKKPYHIVTRAARGSATVIEQSRQANGQILLPILNLLENASQVVETVIHEIGRQMLERELRRRKLRKMNSPHLLVSARGYANAKVTATWANSKGEVASAASSAAATGTERGGALPDRGFSRPAAVLAWKMWSSQAAKKQFAASEATG